MIRAAGGNHPSFDVENLKLIFYISFFFGGGREGGRGKGETKKKMIEGENRERERGFNFRPAFPSVYFRSVSVPLPSRLCFSM